MNDETSSGTKSLISEFSKLFFTCLLVILQHISQEWLDQNSTLHYMWKANLKPQLSRCIVSSYFQSPQVSHLPLSRQNNFKNPLSLPLDTLGTALMCIFSYILNHSWVLCISLTMISTMSAFTPFKQISQLLWWETMQ